MSLEPVEVVLGLRLGGIALNDDCAGFGCTTGVTLIFEKGVAAAAGRVATRPGGLVDTPPEAMEVSLEPPEVASSRLFSGLGWVASRSTIAQVAQVSDARLTSRSYLRSASLLSLLSLLL